MFQLPECAASTLNFLITNEFLTLNQLKYEIKTFGISHF